jgi:hypothetical protein
MSKQTIEVEVPDGYRRPKYDELFLDSEDGSVLKAWHNWDANRVVVRKVEKWRPATVADVQNGKAVRARFWDSGEPQEGWDSGEPQEGWLAGVNLRSNGITFWVKSTGTAWKNCEVLDD